MADPGKEFIKAAKAGDLGKLRALLASDESLLGVRGIEEETLHKKSKKMPRACPVEFHDRRYTNLLSVIGCHGLGPSRVQVRS